MSQISGPKSLKNFLSTLPGGVEVGLVIAKDEKELSNFAQIMEMSGFKRSENTGDLFEIPKTFLIVTDNVDKNIYDFIAQYPTGQIEIFDKEVMQSKTLSPDYKDSAVALLVNRTNIDKIQGNGFE